MVGATTAGGVPGEAPEISGPHPHHWIIGKQDGPSSEGVCKECGEVREFTNGFRRSFPGAFRVPQTRPAPGNWK